jgi:hypothetical protein
MLVAISVGEMMLVVPLTRGLSHPPPVWSKRCPAVRKRSSEISVPVPQRTPETLPGLV